MAWRNLRAEISEIFEDFSQGEERSEFVQQLWAQRKAEATYNAERYAAWKRDDPWAWRKLMERIKRWYEKNKEWVSEYKRRWYAQNWERLQEKYQTNREALSAKSKTRYAEHREERKAKALARYYKHRKEINKRRRESAKEYYYKNREKINAKRSKKTQVQP